jgi:hypothetical protein
MSAHEYGDRGDEGGGQFQLLRKSRTREFVNVDAIIE